MAEIVDPEHADRLQRGAPLPRYPWPEWSDGQWRRAVRGSDFTCTAQSFRNNAYAYANRNGLKAEVIMTKEGVLFRLRPNTVKGTFA